MPFTFYSNVILTLIILNGQRKQLIYTYSVWNAAKFYKFALSKCLCILNNELFDILAINLLLKYLLITFVSSFCMLVFFHDITMDRNITIL